MKTHMKISSCKQDFSARHSLIRIFLCREREFDKTFPRLTATNWYIVVTPLRTRCNTRSVYLGKPERFHPDKWLKITQPPPSGLGYKSVLFSPPSRYPKTEIDWVNFRPMTGIVSETDCDKLVFSSRPTTD